MKVAVLGCGPAGLLAAHAARRYGVECTIFSKKVLSPIGGAQYLHHPIEDLTGEKDGYVSYVKLGAREGYAKKVYGDPNSPTSWNSYEGEHEAWSLEEAYNRLWSMYIDDIVDVQISPESIDYYCENYDLVLSSIPAKELCLDRKYEKPLHDFYAENIFLAPHSMIHDTVDNVVIYSGRKEDSWYRTSRIFGHAWTEYPNRGIGSRFPVLARSISPGLVTGVKPLWTDCDCHIPRSNFYRIGRFGKWQKKQLVTDAWLDACRLINTFKNGSPEGHDILEV